LSVSDMQRGCFVCAKPGGLIAEVKCHTYFQLPKVYRTDRIPSYATHNWTVAGDRT